MALLHAEPLGWISFGLRILDGDLEIARLEVSPFRKRGSFVLEGEAFEIEPVGFFRSGAVLKKGSSVVARVVKPKFYRRRFEVGSAGHRFVLESRGWAGREYELLLGAQPVGRIRRSGFAGRKLEMDFPDNVPLFLQLLLAYVVRAQASRERSAAA